MNRTRGIFIGAGLIILTAVLLAMGRSPAPPADPPPPTRTSAAGDAVRLDARLAGTHVLANGNGEVFLDIALQGAQRPATKRLPLNLALVIDRSGSMAGDKLEHARTAARNLVRRLRVGDRISLVTYGSDVSVLVPSTLIDHASRERVLAAIASITDRGGTFLSGGLEAGRQQVASHRGGQTLDRVILISDGQANEGLTSAAGLSGLARQSATAGVSVTTMGVGLDFNEDVMSAMAEAGNGHYYFINDSSQMATIFQKELEVMMATVAQSPRVKMTLAPHVELLQVYGYDYEQHGREVNIELPALYSEQQRKIICKLRVPADRLGTRPLADLELHYVDAASGHTETLTAAAHVRITADVMAVRSGENAEVLARVEQALAAEQIKNAMGSYVQGNVGQAQAALSAQVRRTESLNRRLKSAQLERVIDALKGQLRASEAAPSSSAGRAFVKRSKSRARMFAK